MEEKLDYNNPDQDVAPKKEESQANGNSVINTNIQGMDENSESVQSVKNAAPQEPQTPDKPTDIVEPINSSDWLYKILALSTVLAGKYRVAFVKGNRTINMTNFKEKKKSIKDIGRNITPLMIVYGKDVVAAGGKLVTPEGVDISDADADKYIAILEGQHRYLAAASLGVDMSNIMVYFDYSGLDYKVSLMAVNATNKGWDLKDYSYCSVMMNPTNAVAKFANELTEKGFSSSTIGQILYFKSGKLGKSAYMGIIDGKDAKPGYDIDRAKAYLKAVNAAGFSMSYQKKRYLISAVASIAETIGDYEVVLKAVSNLSSLTVRILESASSDDAETAAKRAIYSAIENMK